MPEYCITTKELWHSYLYLEADNVDDAISRADQGEGETYDSDYGETIGFVSIQDVNTEEETDLPIGGGSLVAENNPNNIFSISKKQEEVDKAIRILIENKSNTPVRNNALKILLGIKNI